MAGKHRVDVSTAVIYRMPLVKDRSVYRFNGPHSRRPVESPPDPEFWLSGMRVGFSILHTQE